MSKNIDDLRSALFETLEGLKAGTVDIDRARAINEIGKTICDTAKVEVAYLHATGGGESEFLASTIGADNLPAGVTGITRHRLQG
jgi:hypothetical protein